MTEAATAPQEEGQALSELARELRASYFRTYAGTHRCYDSAAWERVADAVREQLGRKELA